MVSNHADNFKFHCHFKPENSSVYTILFVDRVAGSAVIFFHSPAQAYLENVLQKVPAFTLI